MSIAFPFERLKLELRKKINEGEWPFDSRLPSSRKLATQYKCSINTVERAIKELAAEGLLRRENRKGTFITSGISGISGSKSGLIAAFAAEIDHPLWATALKGIEDLIQPFGYNLMVASVKRDIQKLELLIKSIIAKRVDGVIMSPINEYGLQDENRILLSMLLNNGIKVIFLDRYLYGMNIPYISSNNLQGAYQLTQHLINNGHRRIVFIRKANLTTENERWAGYKQALVDHGLQYNQELDLFLVNGNGGYGDEFAAGLKERLRPLDFTAVFTVNYETCGVTSRVLHELGFKVPGDVSLVTFDPEIGANLQLPYKITGISQPFYEMGQVSARLLLEQINGKEKPYVMGHICPSQLLVGNSVRTI
jgi:DNA-binding LacI/PurR family transcriptional regulator